MESSLPSSSPPTAFPPMVPYSTHRPSVAKQLTFCSQLRLPMQSRMTFAPLPVKVQNHYSNEVFMTSDFIVKGGIIIEVIIVVVVFVVITGVSLFCTIHFYSHTHNDNQCLKSLLVLSWENQIAPKTIGVTM